MAGEVGDEEGAGALLAAEAAGAEASFLVAVEGDAHVLHGDDFASGHAAHDLDGVLVAEVVAAFDRLEGVLFPVVAAVGEGGVDAALGGAGVAADGIELANEGGVGAVGIGGEGGAHTG